MNRIAYNPALLINSGLANQSSNNRFQSAKIIKPQMANYNIEDNHKQITKDKLSEVQQKFQKILNNQTIINLPNPLRPQKQNIKSKEQYNKKKDNIKYVKPHYTPKKVRNQVMNSYSASMRAHTTKYLQDQAKKKQQIKEQQKQHQLKGYFYRYSIAIREYQIESDSNEFLVFQRVNYKLWDVITRFIQQIEEFTKHYQIKHCNLQLKKLLEIIQTKALINQNDKVLTNNQILWCLSNGEDLSQQHQRKKGIRYYGEKGKKRAVIKIQSHLRKWLTQIKFKRVKYMVSKIVFIQRWFKIKKLHDITKEKIKEIQLKKMEEFKKIQQKFIDGYNHSQITKKIKYQIHVCTHSVSEWQRISTSRLISLQNSQICRIFRVFNPDQTIETRVIYVSPVTLQSQIINYYRKIFEVAQFQRFQDRVTFITPSISQQSWSSNLSLTKALFFSIQTLQRIKNIIGNQYAYIVPSIPSNDFIMLSQQLQIPLYSSNPQTLLYYQTKSGTKQLVQRINKSLLDNKPKLLLRQLPSKTDIYSSVSLINELSELVIAYPQINRWFLKIDDENKSRGLSYLDVSKIIPPKLLSNLRSETTDVRVKYKDHLSSLFQQYIFKNEKQVVSVSDKSVYKNQKVFLANYFARGGIIEGSINAQKEPKNTSYSVQIRPNQTHKILSTYLKINTKKKTVGCLFSPSISPSAIEEVELIIQYLISIKIFGFFTFDFIEAANPKTQLNLFFLNGIHCHLNQFSSANFLRRFLSKDSHMLYIPIIDHPSIQNLRIHTFFHLCRLQNISFDIGRKIGNVFMFTDVLEGGCLGMITFSQTTEDTYSLAAEVLDFFNSKLSVKILKKLPESFTSVRNAVKGFMKQRERERAKRCLKQDSQKIY